ncbi:MAG: sugar kinase [Oscillospiraceae bacterium]|nr:sugar kinase [Oscillospiraceae bacterium]MBQ6846665.1 sugar kinase [Oscillospiraceae bacterium]
MEFIKSSADFDLISFGEVMLRLSAPDKEKISQSETFEKNCGGSEFNVASGAANLGIRAAVVTKLPKNKLGHFISRRIRYGNVSDDYVVWDDTDTKRLGIYYYENGVFPRKSAVVYDRANASVCSLSLSEIPDDIYKRTRVFHISSISLALSPMLRETALQMIKLMKANGVAISFDVNYRAALWSEEEARSVVEKIFPMVDILFVSEETSRRMLRRTGTLDEIMKGYADDYGCKIVATTRREVASPTRHNFGSRVYFDGKFYEEEHYKNIEVIDRVGSGDAYVAGVLFAILTGKSVEEAMCYGNALSAIKNTVIGDMSISSIDEVESVIKSHRATGVQDELVR